MQSLFGLSNAGEDGEKGGTLLNKNPSGIETFGLQNEEEYKLQPKQRNMASIYPLDDAIGSLKGEEMNELLNQIDDKLTIKQYNEVTEKQQNEAKKFVNELVEKYVNGEYTNNALGQLKSLEDDQIVDLLSDMLYFQNNPYLNVEAMNMMYRHFK